MSYLMKYGESILTQLKKKKKKKRIFLLENDQIMQSTKSECAWNQKDIWRKIGFESQSERIS